MKVHPAMLMITKERGKASVRYRVSGAREKSEVRGEMSEAGTG
jgi:hypothetical protein